MAFVTQSRHRLSLDSVKEIQVRGGETIRPVADGSLANKDVVVEALLWKPIGAAAAEFGEQFPRRVGNLGYAWTPY